MRFSSLSGADRGVGRNGRWFVLVFLCVALILAVLPAASLGYSHGPKVTLKASAKTIVATSSLTLTATATNCPKVATFTFKAVTPRGMSTIGTAAAVVNRSGTATATLKLKPTRSAGYVVILSYSGGSATSSQVDVTVKAKLTLCVTPGTYCGTVNISGTMIPAWVGGSVTVTISKLDRCNRLRVAAELTVPLRATSGDSSTYATDWSGKKGTKYYFKTCVADGSYFAGNCTSGIWVKL